jgi:16S rRNA (cytidine1402-2'-O)-methyltransferase
LPKANPTFTIYHSPFTIYHLPFIIYHKEMPLYMLPLPIADKAGYTIPAYAADLMRQVQVFVMERGKTGRQLLKDSCPDIKLQDKIFIEMAEAPHEAALFEVEKHLAAGRDVAVVSESGCPGVADPGAVFAEGAHLMGVRVIPVVGPSSILLALMASGFNGQQFAFIGYLTSKKEDLPSELTRIESRSRQQNQTQIFIETPYRNRQMLDAAVRTLQPNTRLCFAFDINGPDEWIISMPIHQWRKAAMPDLEKKPAIFLILG